MLSVCELNRNEKSYYVNTCVDVSSLSDRDSLVSVDSGFLELASGGASEASRVCDDRGLFSDDLFGSLVDSCDDSDTLKVLITHFNDILKLDVGGCPRLSRMAVSKQFRDIISKVNYCVELIVSHKEFCQCVHLLYDLIPFRQRSSHDCSWQLRLEDRIQSSRRDLSRLVAGSFLPCTKRWLSHMLRE